MKLISLNKVRDMRKDRNADLLRRMRNGDSLSSFDSYASWYPPRPIVEKDDGAIKKLYGTQTDARLDHAKGGKSRKMMTEVKPLHIA